MTTDEYFRQHGEHRDFIVNLMTSVVEDATNQRTHVLSEFEPDAVLAADILRAMGEPVPYYTLPESHEPSQPVT